MAVIIPTTAAYPHYEQETELDGAVYRIELRWNDRAGAWFMALATASGTVIRTGIKLVPNWPLLRKVRHADRPPGELVVLDQQGVGITRDNLGAEVLLTYAEASEVGVG